MIQPTPPRATLTDEPEGLRITIPACRHWGLIVFLGIWLCGWAIGEIAVPLTFLRYAAPWGLRAFILVWLLLWTVIGLSLGYVWIWTVSGREVLLVDGKDLGVSRRSWISGRTRRFPMAEIGGLRVDPMPLYPFFEWWRFTASLWAVTGGHIRFDYAAKTYRLGRGIDEAEAKMVVSRILERFPSLDQES
ncbi:MAG TPA: hypothetical protein VMY87_03160 [Armatimonadota bacterium]|nr:hypothetical protein [Armatimonadota bacterium]